MLLRASLLFALTYALVTVAVWRLSALPEAPMLRAAALCVPVIVAGTVVASWYEAGAPWPRARYRLRARARRWSLAFGAR